MAEGETASISTILQDVEYFEATFGSTRAARAKVEAQTHEIAALRRRVAELRALLGRAEKEGEALRARFAPASLFEHLKREFVCLGGLQLLEQSLMRWHAGDEPQVAVPPRTVFLAVHETNIAAERQAAPATPPTSRFGKATPIRTPVTPSSSSSIARACEEAKKDAKDRASEKRKRWRRRKRALAASIVVSPSDDDDYVFDPAPRRTRAAAKQAKASAGGVCVKRTTNDVIVKQIIEWPSDRRNLVNMKQSAMFLTLKGIEALEEKEPWNDMFIRRARCSSLIDPEAISERGLKWLKSTLRTQFVLRREFWERLHWLPISETVCVGVEWSKYRKARTRRALYAARVWRKLYEESIELMASGVLRDDVWCDPALWYMPASHVSWLPKSGDLLAELAAEDYEHPSRTYFAAAPSWHPFYQDERFTEFIETRYELPSFSPHQVAPPTEDERAEEH